MNSTENKLQPINVAVSEFVRDYELDSGEGSYQPTEHERFLLEDAILTILDDVAFKDALTVPGAITFALPAATASASMQERFHADTGYDWSDTAGDDVRKVWLDGLAAATTEPALITAPSMDAPSEVSTDQLIELTAHLERVRALAIVEAVQKIGTKADPATVNSHFCGWATALEEVEHRLKTEAWGMLPNGGWGPTGAANEDDRPSPEFPALLRRALDVPQPAASADFPARIMALLVEVADRKGTETKAPWEDGNGEPLQDDADAALAWIAAAAPTATDVSQYPKPDRALQKDGHRG